jgi:hypothetical protein
MGNVNKSQANNITSPNGNSLALFVDSLTNEIKVKDINGNVQLLSDFFANEQKFDPLFTDASGTTRGAKVTGYYTIINPLTCFFRVFIDFSTCTNFGTGQYQITLPFASVQTMRQAGGTLHQTAGNSLYHIAGITDNDYSSIIHKLYYSGSTTDLAWKYNTPVGATSITTQFDLSGTYQFKNGLI